MLNKIRILYLPFHSSQWVCFYKALIHITYQLKQPQNKLLHIKQPFYLFWKTKSFAALITFCKWQVGKGKKTIYSLYILVIFVFIAGTAIAKMTVHCVCVSKAVAVCCFGGCATGPCGGSVHSTELDPWSNLSSSPWCLLLHSVAWLSLGKHSQPPLTEACTFCEHLLGICPTALHFFKLTIGLLLHS